MYVVGAQCRQSFREGSPAPAVPGDGRVSNYPVDAASPITGRLVNLDQTVIAQRPRGSADLADVDSEQFSQPGAAAVSVSAMGSSSNARPHATASVNAAPAEGSSAARVRSSAARISLRNASSNASLMRQAYVKHISSARRPLPPSAAEPGDAEVGRGETSSFDAPAGDLAHRLAQERMTHR